MNTGLIYYKRYFNSLKFKNNGDPVFNGKPATEKLTRMSLTTLKEKELVNSTSFELITTYPGLLIGAGTPHEIGSTKMAENNKGYLVQNEIRLGLFFDHVSGLPTVPGSSVKGVLRDAFSCKNYLSELLSTIFSNPQWSTNTQKEQWLACSNKMEYIETLETTIFDGQGTKSTYERDCFYNAIPVKSKNEGAKFLGTDFITHHKSPLESPNPVQFLKVLPQVVFQFRFRLYDSTILSPINLKPEITASQKLRLFQLIIEDLGVGAKTNVGYGQFTSNENQANKMAPHRSPAIEEKVRALEEEEKRKRDEQKLKEQKEIERLIGIVEQEEIEHLRKAAENAQRDKNLLANGLLGFSAKTCDFNRFKNEVELYLKIGGIINSQKEIIRNELQKIIAAELKSNRTKRDWSKKGKGSWYKIQQWFDTETAESWYDQFIP